MQEPIRIFAGSSNRQLSERVSDYLNLPLGARRITRFADGEIFINIEESVRGHHAYILQSTSTPANEHLMELLIMIDALKRASASEITVVIPYYGYARQDRKAGPREPITAKLVADMLECAGATRVIALDLHAAQVQGFFNIPVDNLYAMPIFLEDIQSRFDLNDVVLVAPDAGGVERARMYAKKLQCSLAIIDKRRPKPNIAEVMNIIGDVSGKVAIVIDDMIDTGGTLCKGAEAVVKAGATAVYAYATHAVFSDAAVSRIDSSSLTEVVVTDSIPLRANAEACSKIRVLSAAPLIGETVRRVHNAASVSSLFV